MPEVDNGTRGTYYFNESAGEGLTLSKEFSRCRCRRDVAVHCPPQEHPGLPLDGRFDKLRQRYGPRRWTRLCEDYNPAPYWQGTLAGVAFQQPDLTRVSPKHSNCAFQTHTYTVCSFGGDDPVHPGTMDRLDYYRADSGFAPLHEWWSTMSSVKLMVCIVWDGNSRTMSSSDPALIRDLAANVSPAQQKFVLLAI